MSDTQIRLARMSTKSAATSVMVTTASTEVENEEKLAILCKCGHEPDLHMKGIGSCTLASCPCVRYNDHDWRFDGDDPYLICECGARRDALTGAAISEGRGHG